MPPSCRRTRSTSCRSQPLRTRRRMGPAQRIHSHAVVGSLSPCLHAQNKGRPAAPYQAQQHLKDGSPDAEGVPQQPCSARLSWKSIVCERHAVPRPCHWLSWPFSPRDAAVAGIAHEPSRHYTQSSLLVRVSLGAIDATAISLSKPVDAPAGRHARCFAKHRRRHVSEHQDDGSLC